MKKSVKKSFVHLWNNAKECRYFIITHSFLCEITNFVKNLKIITQLGDFLFTYIINTL